MVKRTDSSGQWSCYHKGAGATHPFFLDVADAPSDTDGAWNDTAPTNTVFTVKNSPNVNANNGTHMAYCWTGISGYSKFDSWSGTGSNHFLHLGFRPAFIMWKCTSHSGDWEMYDLGRTGYNGGNSLLYPCYTNTEAGSGVAVDLLSNGVRFHGGNNHCNGSGRTFCYMAWADNPFKTTRAR